MPNQLSLAFKKTTPIPIKDALEEYIRTHYVSTHPDAFNWDIKHWEALRADALNETVHQSKVDVLLRYHAQLVFILTKLPSNIALSIPYTSTLSPSNAVQELPNLLFERAAVLFNLAALYSQLAVAQDRSNTDGIKRAILHAQSAAGTLNYLHSSVLPKLRDSLEHGQTLPEDLAEDALRSFENLMLAQAQEGVWQRAVLDNLKNGLVAKLAMKTSSFYEASVMAITNAPRSTKMAFPSSWLAHLEVKQLHFEAAAHYRKSIEDLEADRYGQEIAHLALARSIATKAQDIARHGRVAPAVSADLKGLLEALNNNITRAERDNDFIYHDDVPPATSLEPIAVVTMAKSTPSAGLLQPQQLLESAQEGIILGELMSWGAIEAVNVYNDRRTNWIKEAVIDRAQELDAQVSNTLQAMHLPAALDALDKPIGLPPSLLRKAEEVRLEDGPHRIDVMFRDVQALAKSAKDILEQGMDVLDAAVEDGAATPEILVAKYRGFQDVLQKAAGSDHVTAKLWDEWEDYIMDLTQDEAALEAQVPSTTMSAATSNRETKSHSRALRRSLEALDDLKRVRDDAVRRANQLADADDIQGRIAREAAGVARWAEVTPAMFEDSMQEELFKFEKFRKDIDLTVEKQQALLADIKVHQPAFMQSRKEDPTVKERERVLQYLDLAYFKYKEICENLQDGQKFYNDIAERVTKFQRECQDWALQTRLAAVRIEESVSRSPHTNNNGVPRPAQEQHVSTEATAKEPVTHAQPSKPTPPANEPVLQSQSSSPVKRVLNLPPPPGVVRKSAKLPPPGSGDWEAVDFAGFGGAAKPKAKSKKVAQAEP